MQEIGEATSEIIWEILGTGHEHPIPLSGAFDRTAIWQRNAEKNLRATLLYVPNSNAKSTLCSVGPIKGLFSQALVSFPQTVAAIILDDFWKRYAHPAHHLDRIEASDAFGKMVNACADLKCATQAHRSDRITEHVWSSNY